MKKLSILFIALLSYGHAFADDVVKSECKQPVILNPLASNLATEYFNKRRDAYEKCINSFVKQQQDLMKSEVIVVKANAAHDAADAAIKEFNEFTAALNERNRRANGEDEDDQKEKDK